MNQQSWGIQQGCKIRIHGGSSRDYSKRSYRVTFDSDRVQPESDDFPFWSTSLTFRAEYNDPTYLRNHLTHELFRQWTQIPTPRTRHIQLSINGELQGLYLEVERIDDLFLRRWNRSQPIALIESDPDLEYAILGMGSLVPLPGYLEYTQGYDLKIGLSLTPLKDWIENDLMEAYESASTTPPSSFYALKSSLVWNHYLDYLSIMVLVQNRDFIRKNYYLSLQGNSTYAQWEFYPWDLDLTWGCTYNDEQGHTLCDDLESMLNPEFGLIPTGSGVSFPTDGFYNLLFHIVLTHPQTRTHFRRRLCTLMESELWQNQIESWISGYTSYLAPLVNDDPRDRLESVEEFNQAIEKLIWFKENHSSFLSSFFDCDAILDL